MKKIYHFLIFLFLNISFQTGLFAQQDPQFTQFMFNQLALNPAYAGSHLKPCLTAIHRQQWAGLDGAPVSSAISFDTPMANNRVGFGVNLIHDKIGPTTSWNASLAYAYRVPVENGTFSFGLQGNIRQYRVDWLNESTTHTGDNLLSDALESKILPNAGLGLYYQSSSFYLGFSAPHLLKGDLSLLESTLPDDQLSSLEERHFFGMIGFLVKANQTIQLKPSALVKYVKNAPVDVDLNLSAIFYDKFWAGVSYRWGGSTQTGVGESIDLIVQYQVSESLRFGLGYDITLSEIKAYSSGSYEFFAHYCINKDKESVTNPRFF